MEKRVYERGENRQKHVGKEAYPVIEIVKQERIGKCPAGMPESRKEKLLAQALPYFTDPPYSKEFPKRLFAVDQDGTIYAGQTTEVGRSYHGYPYAGPLGRNMIEALRNQAREQGCEREFDKWLNKHITKAGKPDL